MAAALDGIPPAIGRLIDNVAVFVEDGASTATCSASTRAFRSPARENYGLGGGMPDRITIYRLPILARCNSEAEVIDAVRITVVHEVGHHFGLTDARLRELGYG